MQAASIQMAVVEGDKSKTIEKAAEKIRLCQEADLIVLPEIWNIEFMSFDRYISEAENKDGPTLRILRELAREVGSYLHTGGFVENENGKYYNSSYLLPPQGDILVSYRKVHLFGYNSMETNIITPGDNITGEHYRFVNG